MDYTNAFGAESREVQDRTHDGQAVRVVVATRLYATVSSSSAGATSLKAMQGVRRSCELGACTACARRGRIGSPWNTWVRDLNGGWTVRLGARGSPIARPSVCGQQMASARPVTDSPDSDCRHYAHIASARGSHA